jgi:hypothetical protein
MESNTLMKQADLEATKRLMGSLVRMKPKPHDQMKLGRAKDVAESAKKDSSRAKKKKSGRRPSKIGD